MSKSTSDVVKEQTILAAVGAGLGAVTKQPMTSQPLHPAVPVVAQVSSAMGAAARNGSSAGGVLAAGGAVVTAKVAAGVAAATAAAPFVIGAAVVGGVGYGIYKLFGGGASPKKP